MQFKIIIHDQLEDLGHCILTQSKISYGIDIL